MDLEPPLRVGHLSASALHSDRTGLKKQLTRELWLAQVGRREGYRCGVSLQRQRGKRDVATARGMPCVHLGKFSLDHLTLAVAGGTGSWEGRCGYCPVLAHRLLGGCSSSLSVSCPSLRSLMIAATRAHLWSSLSGTLNPSPRVPGNKEARKSLLPLWQLQTFSRTPSQPAVAY